MRPQPMRQERDGDESRKGPELVPERQMQAGDEKACPLEAGARSFVLAMLLLTGSTCTGAYPKPAWQQPATPAATPRHSANVIAGTQKNASSDVEVARHIRRAIFEDRSLSTDAHNVKIITRNGVVTLKGPVQSRAEKETLEHKAAEIVGQANVVSKVRVISKSPAI